MTRICPKCGEPGRASHADCAPCHAANMREWRKSHPMTAEQRRKANCRSYAGIYKRRGKIEAESCSVCGAEDAEMHHEDYGRPLDIEWLCRSCHLSRHAGMLPRETLAAE